LQARLPLLTYANNRLTKSQDNSWIVTLKFEKYTAENQCACNLSAQKSLDSSSAANMDERKKAHAIMEV
jgi:hypothetical protein